MATAIAKVTRETILKVIQEWYDEHYNDLKQEFGGGGGAVVLSDGITVVDDGTTVTFAYGGEEYWKFRKVDKQLLLHGGTDDGSW